MVRNASVRTGSRKKKSRLSVSPGLKDGGKGRKKGGRKTASAPRAAKRQNKPVPQRGRRHARRVPPGRSSRITPHRDRPSDPPAAIPAREKEEDRLVVCSVTTASNLYRAKVMARSVKTFDPSATVLICLVEETMHPSAVSPYVDRWVLAKDMDIPDFHRNIFKYNVNEGTASMKAAAFKYAMKQFPQQCLFLYFDTDMRVYYPLGELKALMKQHPILLTPHILDPSRHRDIYRHDGLFNAGMIGLKRSEQASGFLDWWERKLYEDCYMDDRTFADQGWLDFAPLYFDAATLRHPGYNMAAWNIGETGRDVTHTDNGNYYLYDKPLVVFHYSGIHWGLLQDNLKTAYPDGNNLLYRMLDAYFEELKEMGMEQGLSIPWSYDYFANQEYIRPETKRAFREHADTYARVPNPFKLSNAYFKQAN